MSTPVITFLSDYGHRDEFVGVCHGVIARRCPAARVIDISHAIPARDIRAGAIVLADALPYMPAGVHLAVVDPGVGASGGAARAAVAVRSTATPGRLFVGPDNGLLAPAIERFGGALEAVEISHSPERLQPVSRTFHGRDVFAPVAAALAAGAALAEVGERTAARALTQLELPLPEYRGDALAVHVLRSDGFGNLVLDAAREQVEVLAGGVGARVEIATGAASHGARVALAFADVEDGELLVYEDANGALAIAANGGSAAEVLGVDAGAELLVRPA